MPIKKDDFFQYTHIYFVQRSTLTDNIYLLYLFE